MKDAQSPRLQGDRSKSATISPCATASVWGVGVVAYLVIYHLLTCSSFALLPPLPGSSGISLGVLYNAADNLSYASWAEQVTAHSHLAAIAYTTEPNARIYFNPLFVTVGTVAQMANVRVTGVLYLFGLIGVFLAVSATYLITHRSTRSNRIAGWAVAILCLGSGLSVVGDLSSRMLGQNPILWHGADAQYLDAFGSSTFVAYPYQSFCLAWTAISILLVLISCQIDREWFLPSIALTSAVVAVLGLLHPYEGPMLVGTFVIYTASRVMIRGWKRERRRAVVAAFVSLAILPALLYADWLTRFPVWNNFANASLELRRSTSFWLIGYGAIIPLFAIGLMDRTISWTNDVAWLGIWVALCFLFLIVFNVAATRIAATLPIPMAVLSAVGWSHIIDKVFHRRNWNWAPAVGLAVWGAVLVSSYFGLLFSKFHEAKIDTEAWEALKTIEAGKLAGARVLGDEDVGMLAPGIARVTVFVGHWALTPDYHEKLSELARAGFVNSLPTTNHDLAAFKRLVNQSDADWVLTRKASDASKFARDDVILKVVFIGKVWALFRRIEPESLSTSHK